MGVTSVRLVCHELRVITHPFVWFVMNFISIRLVCHELRIIVYLFTWSVMGVTSVRLVCHGLHIYSSGLSSAVHPFVWFVMDFTSSCIHSSGLS